MKPLQQIPCLLHGTCLRGLQSLLLCRCHGGLGCHPGLFPVCQHFLYTNLPIDLRLSDATSLDRKAKLPIPVLGKHLFEIIFQ